MRVRAFGYLPVALPTAITFELAVIDDVANGRTLTTVGSVISDVTEGISDERGVALPDFERGPYSKRLNDTHRYGSKSGSMPI